MSNGSNQHLSCSSFKNYSSGILSLPHPSIHTDKSKIIDNDQSPTKCSGSPLYLGVIPIIWKSLSCVATLSMEFSRQEYWSGWPFPSPGRGSSQPRDWTWVSCIANGFFTIWATKGNPSSTWILLNIILKILGESLKARLLLNYDMNLAEQKYIYINYIKMFRLYFLSLHHVLTSC